MSACLDIFKHPNGMLQLFDGDGKRVGLESFSDQEVANLFNLNEIQMYELKNGMHIRGTSTFFDESGQRKSLIHALLYKK